MDKLLVSIITPTYNHEDFICRCIESVLAQEYPHWEQIIVDDGSDDNTPKLISNYNDSRIKYIRQENKGILRLKESYNTALKYSNGQIIAILEGDDYWPSDKLEKQILSFNDPEVIFSWGKANIVNFNDKIVGYRPKSLPWLKKKSNREILKYLLFGNFIPACTVMCRKETLKRINGFKQPENTPYVDHLTWLELGLNGEFYYMDEILGYWRHHDRQISSVMSVELFQSLKNSIEFYKEKYKDFKFKVNLFDLIVYDLIQIKYNIFSIQRSNEGNKEQSKMPLLLKLNRFFRSIYAIFKINLIWGFLLVKMHFKA